MPATLRPITPFDAFRFVVLIGDKTVMLSEVVSDPFTGDLWLGAAHQVGAPTVYQRLSDATMESEAAYRASIGSDGSAAWTHSYLDVWLLPRAEPVARRVRAVFPVNGVHSRPLSLHASSEQWAVEWVQIKDVQYDVQDVGPDDLPIVVRGCLKQG